VGLSNRKKEDIKIYTEVEKGKFDVMMLFTCDDLKERQIVAYSDDDICIIGCDYIYSRDYKAVESFCYQYGLSVEQSA